MQERPAEGSKLLPLCAGRKGCFFRHPGPALFGSSPPFAPLAVLLRQNRRAAPLLGGASDARAPGREEQVAFPLRRPERMLFPAPWACPVWQLSSVRSARGFAQAKPESSPAAGWGVGCKGARPRGASCFSSAPAERMLFPARWACAVWQHFSPHPCPARGFARVKQESGSAVGWGVGCRITRPGGASPFPPAPAGRDAFPGRAEHNIKQSPLCWAALGQSPERTACPPPAHPGQKGYLSRQADPAAGLPAGRSKKFSLGAKTAFYRPRVGHFQTHIRAIHKGQAATGRLALVFATPAGLQ